MYISTAGHGLPPATGVNTDARQLPSRVGMVVSSRGMSVRLADVDGDVRGQPRAQRELAGRIDQRDANGDALHDLHEVARRVVGREQREARARAGRQAVDAALDL